MGNKLKTLSACSAAFEELSVNIAVREHTQDNKTCQKQKVESMQGYLEKISIKHRDLLQKYVI